mmetsp:Transcript_20622/g.33985  ORF Transcript_20622/g.33985 Transcript_20622/m.33985 type:complete len:87 (+) Transcript_20622:1256-1516(+)
MPSKSNSSSCGETPQSQLLRPLQPLQPLPPRVRPLWPSLPMRQGGPWGNEVMGLVEWPNQQWLVAKAWGWCSSGRVPRRGLGGTWV